jgi:3-keto-5-aminohexanoate cleavage enzyme
MGRYLEMPDLLEPYFPLVLAPTGMIPTKSSTPHVPITPKEIALDVERCSRIGVTSVHIHARDESGAPDWKLETYKAIVSEVKHKCPDILINVSTSGRNWQEFEKRADCLALDGDLKPDLASLTLSSLNFLSGPSMNPPDVIEKLAIVMLDRGITPELEIFDLGMVNMVRVLKGKGLLPNAIVANLFMGNIAGIQATLGELAILVERLPSEAVWSGAGIGIFRERAHALSLAAGGGVRVGLEDGIFMDSQRRVLAQNEDLVSGVHEMGALLGRTPMTPDHFRRAVLSRAENP